MNGLGAVDLLNGMYIVFSLDGRRHEDTYINYIYNSRLLSTYNHRQLYTPTHHFSLEQTLYFLSEISRTEDHQGSIHEFIRPPSSSFPSMAELLFSPLGVLEWQTSTKQGVLFLQDPP